MITAAPSMVGKYWVLGSDWEPIRRIIYTTNAIESMNSAVRWAVRTRGNFPHDRAATKLLYLALRNVERSWRAPPVFWHQARIELFRTARELGRHRLAVNALSAMMSGGRWESLFAQRDPVLGEQSFSTTIDEHTARQFLHRSGFEPRERSRLAREAGDSLEQLGRLGAATAVYQAVLQLDPGTEGEGQVREEVEQAVARLRLERSELSRNARVRPVISKNLEQDRLVRPRGPLVEGEGSL